MIETAVIELLAYATFSSYPTTYIWAQVSVARVLLKWTGIQFPVALTDANAHTMLIASTWPLLLNVWLQMQGVVADRPGNDPDHFRLFYT